jgi:phage repressor protein C with HTH and peptisase S24 domain
MEQADPRAVLAALIEQRGEDYASLSRLLGRNPAYVQQYIRRGSPRRLSEADRAILARYFDVPETMLGAPDRIVPTPMVTVPRLDIGASAGPGALAEDRAAIAGFAFSESWLRRLRPGGGSTGLSLIRVSGTSMEPTLADGDEILVDGADGIARLREGIYVIRAGAALLVKRLVRDRDGFAVTSDNPSVGPVDLGDPEAVAIVGRVLWIGRKL